jgi:hypothetical protein
VKYRRVAFPIASIPPTSSGRVSVGDFPMHRFLFAATAIAAVVAVAVSMMGGQQVIDDHAHRQCVEAGHTPSTPLYFQCRARVIQPIAIEHQEAAAH